MSVPLVVRLPRGRRGGSVCDALVAPEDLFSTLCGIDVPRTISGRNQVEVGLGHAGAAERQALFTYSIDDALLTGTTGSEWKGCAPGAGVTGAASTGARRCTTSAPTRCSCAIWWIARSTARLWRDSRRRSNDSCASGTTP